jgi:hypothetical protein
MISDTGIPDYLQGILCRDSAAGMASVTKILVSRIARNMDVVSVSWHNTIFFRCAVFACSLQEIGVIL